MLITNSTAKQSLPTRPAMLQSPAPSVAPSAPSDTFSFSSIDVKSGILFGAFGVLPVLGAISNFGAGAESGFNGNSAASTAGGIGVLSNLAGTATLAGGLLLGNHTAVNVGLSMLGISGLTAAYAGFF